MISTILDKIRLTDTWQLINLKTYNDCYLIGIKREKNKKDLINSIDVQSIKFELGIESGIKDQPLTIQTISLNFNDMTSFNESLNEITAFTRILNIPSEFYIRPISITTKDSKEIKSGEVNITINVNAVDLG